MFIELNLYNCNGMGAAVLCFAISPGRGKYLKESSQQDSPLDEAPVEAGDPRELPCEPRLLPVSRTLIPKLG